MFAPAGWPLPEFPAAWQTPPACHKARFRNVPRNSRSPRARYHAGSSPLCSTLNRPPPSSYRREYCCLSSPAARESLKRRVRAASRVSVFPANVVARQCATQSNWLPQSLTADPSSPIFALRRTHNEAPIQTTREGFSLFQTFFETPFLFGL